MNFNEKIERRGTHSDKWDMMESKYGVSPKDGIPMWVADMDFRPPECIQKAVENLSAKSSGSCEKVVKELSKRYQR